MILDKEEHRKFLIEVLNEITVKGKYSKLVAEIQVAVETAKLPEEVK